jgi:hypothetical protein
MLINLDREPVDQDCELIVVEEVRVEEI